MLGECLSSDDVDKLHDVFTSFDRNKDGVLDKDEVMAILRSLLPNCDSAQLNRACSVLVGKVDLDSSETIDFEEFKNACLAPSECIGEEKGEAKAVNYTLTDDQILVLRHTFAMIDSNGNGKVSFNELKEILKTEMHARFKGVSEDALHELVSMAIKGADVDNDGQLSLDEFLAAYSAGKQIVSIETIVKENKGVQRYLNEWEYHALRRSFQCYDRNGDGFLDRDEIAAIFVEQSPDGHVDTILGVADIDKDDKLSLLEFIKSFCMEDGVLPEELITRHQKEGDMSSLAIYFSITTQQYTAVRDLLSSLDAGLNEVGTEAFTTALQNLVHSWGGTEEEMHMLFKGFVSLATKYKNSSNMVSLSGFVTALADFVVCADRETVVFDLLSNLDAKRELIRTFLRLDVNNDGYLEKEELAETMHKLLAEASKELQDDKEAREDIIAAILAAADLNKDGKLNLVEFISSYYSKRGVLPLRFVHDVSNHIGSQMSDAELTVLEKQLSWDPAAPDVNRLLRFLFDIDGGGHEPDDIIEHLTQLVVSCSNNTKDFISFFASNASLVELAAAQSAPAPRRSSIEEILSPMQLQKVVHVFHTIDEDRDGFIPVDEVKELVNRLLKERVPELEDDEIRTDLVDTVVEAADIDKDNKLSLNEFLVTFQRNCGLLPMDYVLETAAKVAVRLSKQEIAHLKNAFMEVDKNNDGIIDKDELMNLLRSIIVAPDKEALDEIADMIFQCTDCNSDNKICLTEFIRSFAVGEGVGGICAFVDVQELKADLEVCVHGVSCRQVAQSSTVEAGNVNRELTAKVMTSTAAGTDTPLRMDTPDHVGRASFPNDVSGVAYTSSMLRKTFREYDKDDNGFVNREEFKEAYRNMEWCGLEPTGPEIDRLFSQYGGTDAKLSFNEFCLVMLHRAKM